MQASELVEKFRHEHKIASKGLKIAASVFFGIKHADALKNHSLHKIINEAGLNESFYHNIRKGTALEPHVEIKSLSLQHDPHVLISEYKLSEILLHTYENAEELEVLNEVILFGIRYAESLQNISVRQLVNTSGTKLGFASEINIGKNLALHFDVTCKN